MPYEDLGTSLRDASDVQAQAQGLGRPAGSQCLTCKAFLPADYVHPDEFDGQ